MCDNSIDADGRTVSHEAIYQYIYALPRGELARHGILLQSKRTRRRPSGSRKRIGPIVGMVSNNDRPAEVTQRRVPGHCEGDLIIGKAGKSAAVTLVERTTLFTTILALPAGRTSAEVVDAIITHADSIPAMMKRSITWDQGVEMARHAALTLATNMPVYFADHAEASATSPPAKPSPDYSTPTPLLPRLDTTQCHPKQLSKLTIARN